MRPIAMLVLLLLPGCAGMLNATISTAGLAIDRNVPYGSLAAQRLDIYQPPASLPGPHPAVVFLHGGGWRRGSKDMYLFAAAAMARRGAVVAVPDIRPYPEARYPAFLQDAALAVAWMQARAARWGGDPGRVFVMGHSSGAYDAAMLATDPALLAAAGSSQRMLAGFVGLAGPYDFLPITDPDIIPIFPRGDPATMPVNQVRPGRFMPPMLLLAGADDETVRPRNSLSLAERARGAGGEAAVKLYPDTGHVGLVLDLAPWFAHRAPVLDDVMRFVLSHAAAPAG